MFVERQVVTHTTPIESRLAGHMQTWNRLGEEFKTSVPLESIIGKCEHATPEAPQPPGMDVIPGVGRRNSNGAKRRNIERTAAPSFRLKRLQWIMSL